MAKQPFVIYNIKETYHEQGDFSFKIVLDPRKFRNGHGSEVVCTNSDGKRLPMHVTNWGRKVNCSFKIDESVPDGVSVVDMNLKDDAGHEASGRVTFWVIK